MQAQVFAVAEGPHERAGILRLASASQDDWRSTRAKTCHTRAPGVSLSSPMTRKIDAAAKLRVTAPPTTGPRTARDLPASFCLIEKAAVLGRGRAWLAFTNVPDLNSERGGRGPLPPEFRPTRTDPRIPESPSCLRAHRKIRGRCQSPGAVHCPSLRPPTVFGKPIESPTCTAGLLPWQIRFPEIVLVTTSIASGSSTLTLRERIRLPPTVLRIAPAHPPCPALDDQVAADRVVLDREVHKGEPQAWPAADRVYEAMDRVSVQVHRVWMTGGHVSAYRVVREFALAGLEGHYRARGLHPSARIAPLLTRTLRPTCTVPSEKASRHAPRASVRLPQTVRVAPSAT